MLQLFGLILFVKGLFLLLDPDPAFHFGDSGAYLATALTKWIPPDRSFSYGFFLRPLVLPSHSLLPVVLLQTFLSAVASAVLALLLIRYFRAAFRVAVIFSLLCAVEPLQLMSERFVMTEALATFVFALYIWACLEFLRTARNWMLALVQCLAVLLVSLRYSFIPLVLLLSLVLPLLSIRTDLRTSVRPLLGRLAIAVLISQALLFGYRHLYGYLEQTRPAYLSRDGDFLIADVAPLIKPEDFPIAEQRPELFKKITVPLHDINARRLHRWVPGGLCDAMLQIAHGDEDLANQLARKTALRAMKRDPLGLLGLGLYTYREFLSYARMKWSLELDQGHFVSPTANDVTMIRQWFGIDARNRRFGSLTKRWEAMAAPWCWLLVLLPIIYSVELVRHWKQASRPDLFLLLSASVILLAALFPVEIANARYLTPLPWLACLILGVIATRLYYPHAGIPSGASV